MGTYAYTNLLLMERTARVTCTAGALAAQAITIPTITVGNTTIRPVGLAIIDASADFSILQGTATDLGDAVAITATDLSAVSQLSLVLGENDIVVLSDGAGTATVDIRWFWVNAARDGSALGNSYGINLPLKTESLASVTAEAAVTIPTGAVELIIISATEDFLYRVDDGTVNGQQVTVEASHPSMAAPYSIFVNDGDRLRIQRVASDGIIQGYWRIAR